MCGICGVVSLDQRRALEPTPIVEMTDALSHRGPDDDGYFIDRTVHLGHRRLSIIDLDGGRQPILGEDGSAVVLCNGEIYNYRDLGARLRGLGHRFATASDSEVIVHAYEEFGVDCLEHLRGMFAFALWDRRRHSLLLARDRLGIKPLYYYRGTNFLAFASEVKALLKLREVRPAVDATALEQYLSLRYVPAPRTMFRGIQKLPPGHFLLVQDDDVRVRQYWDVDFVNADKLPAFECRARFEELFRDSVGDRMIADVPLGVMLSGGLDSSAVLAQMSELGDERVKSFSVGYRGTSAAEKEANELGYARRVAAHFDADHHEFELAATDFGDFVDRLAWYLDEPLADPTCIPLYFISKLAREHVTVVLSGEGADEMMGGYGIYRRMIALERAYRGLPGAVTSLGSALAGRVSDERLGRYLEAVGRPLERRYLGVSRGFLPGLKSELLGLPAGGGEDSVYEVLDPHWQRTRGAAPLDRMLYLDLKVWLPDDLLLKADRMTMANAMELRVPFLDHRLVELMARVPASLKLRWGTGKRLLRQTIGRKLPPFVLRRRKRGFPVPVGAWMRGQLDALIRERLLSGETPCSRYMDAGVIRRLAGEHRRGEADRSQELWALLIFDAWHRNFLDRPLAARDVAPAAHITRMVNTGPQEKRH